ncbi:MAG: glycosyltransferase family 4 protein, partial [Deltaproteobacteria bacterium]
DHLIVTSDEMRDIAARCGADPAQMSVVPNFLLGQVVRHDHQLTGPLVVGSLGRLTRRKGFDMLVAAAAHAKAQGLDFRLVIGGTGEEASRLAAQAKELGVALELPGWVGNADKSAFLQGLDVFVCPSRFEPFGNVYLEAMQHGVPIVSADTTGARAIFARPEQAIIVPNEDAQALAQGMARLLSDEELRKTMGIAGQLRFAETFSVDVCGPLLSDVVIKTVESWRAR